MNMENKLSGILSNIQETNSSSGGDVFVLELIEEARKKHNLSGNEIEYLKLRMASQVLQEKKRLGLL